MNVLISFRYLNESGPKKYVIHEVAHANELDEIIDEFKSYSNGIREVNNGLIEGFFLKRNGAINSARVKNAKSDVEKICLEKLEKYNRRIEKCSYLVLDEICTIFIKNGKAIPMEDPKEYVNYDDVKRVTQEAIINIADCDEDFELSSYSNVMYLVYIDIIEKGMPLIIFKNSKN